MARGGGAGGGDRTLRHAGPERSKKVQVQGWSSQHLGSQRSCRLCKILTPVARVFGAFGAQPKSLVGDGVASGGPDLQATSAAVATSMGTENADPQSAVVPVDRCRNVAREAARQRRYGRGSFHSSTIDQRSPTETQALRGRRRRPADSVKAEGDGQCGQCGARRLVVWSCGADGFVRSG